MGALWRRIVFLLSRRRFEHDLAEEMQFHVDMKRRAGSDPHAARKQFGNATFLREISREMWGWDSLESLMQDLRYAVRMMRRSPGLTAIAVLSLALGIGANTAIFTVMNAALLRDLPVKDPGRLILVMKHFPSGTGRAFSYPAFTLFRDQNHSFSGILAYVSPQRVWMSDRSSGNLEQVYRSFVSGEYFSVLGVQPLLGRVFSAADDKSPGASPYVVLNYNFWKSRFALDPGVLGKQLVIDETPVTVIGVAPPGFTGVEPGYQPDLWLPAMMHNRACVTNPGCQTFGIMARLKPGATASQAETELEVLHRQHLLSRAGAIHNEAAKKNFLSQYITIASGGSGYSSIGSRFSKPLFVLLAVVAAVLVIACVNVANLLLARATARQKEIAVRLAMGAARLRLLRQFLTESILLALFGGVIGLLFAFWGSRILVALVSGPDIRVVFNLNPDLRVLGFLAVISLTAGLIFGIAPALRATRTDVSPALKQKERSIAGSAGFPVGKVLVVAQVTLSLLVLIGAGLFVRSLQNLRHLDTGYDRQNVVMFSLSLPRTYGAPQAASILKRMLDQVQTFPGVVSASLVYPTPLTGATWDDLVTVEGRAARPDEDLDVNLSAVSRNYFDTLRTPLVAGRNFAPEDTAQSPHVAIVNEAFSQRFFGRANPVGRQFSCPSCSGRAEIIGVARDAKLVTLRDQTPATVFFLSDQLPPVRQSFLARTAGDPQALASAVREAAKSIDRNVRADNIRTLVDQMDNALIQERMIAKLSGFFGALALLLASIGLYGVMSYAVVRRTNEIGIRMALGARAADVLRQVLRETALLVAAGLILGAAAALGLTRLIKAMLFGLTPYDPATIVCMALLLAAIALFAGYLPARRAARVDPMTALRYE